MLSFAAPAVADPFEDAVAAQNNGDYATALRLFRSLANQGDARGQSKLGFMYVNGQGVQTNYVEALKLFRLAASQGYARGQVNLGVMYDRGLVVPKNYVRAYMWSNLAAAQGDPLGAQNRSIVARRMTPAQIALAQEMSHRCQASNFKRCGEPSSAVATDPLEDASEAYVKKDYDTALRLLRPLATKGNVVAQNLLSMMYYEGTGVPEDHAEAAKWIRRAANQGDIPAQTTLGGLYMRGDGVPQDYAEAKKWFHLAADKGDAHAQSFLALMYSGGPWGTPDFAEAKKWAHRAANQGDAHAQNLLGNFYSSEKDYVHAHMWYNLAAAQGTVEDAEKSRDYILMNMTPEQIAEAQKLAREWKPTKQPSR